MAKFAPPKGNLFLFLVTPRVSVRPIFGKKKKKRFCRLSIGEKLAIQYHIQYC